MEMNMTPHTAIPAPKPRQQGFTLLEVLLAIAITGLIGVGTYQLFSSTLRTQDVVERRSAELEQLQRGLALISRDLQQLVGRSVRNAYGDREFALSNRNELYLLELTRMGWRNPLQDPRSDLQRVFYERADDVLYRYYYRVLDRAQDSEPVRQKLLDKIEELEIRFLDERNQWHSLWPLDSMLEQGTSEAGYRALPKAIEIRLRHQRFGNLTRLYEIAGYYRTQDAEQDNGTGDGGPGGNGDEETGQGESG